MTWKKYIKANLRENPTQNMDEEIKPTSIPSDWDRQNQDNIPLTQRQKRAKSS